MGEKGKLYELDTFRKNGRLQTRSEISSFLRSAVGPNYHVSFDPDGVGFVPKAPEVNDVWVTSSLCLRRAPSFGFFLFDRLYELCDKNPRYELSISVITNTKRGKRIDSCHYYELYSAPLVKSQIFWEKSRVCGNGFFAFRNYTEEQDNLFIEPEWIEQK